MPAVGLKDVARIAGVSYKTVSRVVNGEAPVSDETRRRVEAAVAELGYRPNQSARNLRRGRTQTIRLVIHLRGPQLRQERFQDDVVSAVVNQATAANYSVLLELTRTGDSPAQLARFGDRRSDGTILLDGRSDSPMVPVLRGAAEPTVIMVNPDADPGFGSVDADFVGGADVIVSHLIDQGHRRIAHLADDMVIHSSRGRLQGYETALRRAGLPSEGLVEMTGYTRQHGYDGTARLFARASDVTAIVCVNDLTAFGAIDYLRENGLEVPDDVSVTGYDDIALARWSTPPLTTLHIPWFEMAEAATASLIATLGGEQPPLIRQTFPVELVPRETAGPARYRSALVKTQSNVQATKGGS